MKKNLALLILPTLLLTSCFEKTPETCVVDFDTKGGSSVSSQTIERNGKATKPDNPTREGYIFVDWFYGGERWSFPGYTVSENITLEAKWEPIVYEINYVLNGGELNTTHYTYTIEDEFDLDLPTKNDYVKSTGWFDDEFKPYTKITPGMTGDLTLYTFWEQYAYLVLTHENLGGNVEGGGIYKPGETVTLTATPDGGYMFLGFYEPGVDNLISKNPVYTFTMGEEDISIEARFIASEEYNFALYLKSKRKTFKVGEVDKLIVDYFFIYNTNNFEYSSSDDSIASLSSDGTVRFLKEGKAYLSARNKVTGNTVTTPQPVTVIGEAQPANGTFNFSLSDKAEIASVAEKYALDSHLGGIPIAEESSYVAFSDRCFFPASKEIKNYGYGLIEEGFLQGRLTGPEGDAYPDYLHLGIEEDRLNVNQYKSAFNYMDDILELLTSTYWSKKLVTTKEYEWGPELSKTKIYPTKYVDGAMQIDSSKQKISNNRPIPVEQSNTDNLYSKWRVYLKVNGDEGIPLLFRQNSFKDYVIANGSFNNRAVGIDDYVFPFKLLFTGSNNLYRGAKLAHDETFSIKGASEFYDTTRYITDYDAINDLWNEKVGNNELGIKSGLDNNGYYLDFELTNPVDEFTAMYKLSNKLFSPLPEEMFVGKDAIGSTFKKSAENFGTFTDFGEGHILNNFVSCGPYVLEQWEKRQCIVLDKNDTWNETIENTQRFRIPGIYYRLYDLSEDPEKMWWNYQDGNLDIVKVPFSKLETAIGEPGVLPMSGNSIFKLNVNSCTVEEWLSKFGKSGTISPLSNWNVKPYMSNESFLDGLFYSINRKQFAKDRGYTPTANFVPDLYLSDPLNKISYNSTEEHNYAIEDYVISNESGESDYGYNFEKAKLSFKNAIHQLISESKIAYGTSDNPSILDLNLKVRFATDCQHIGEAIKHDIEAAFNDLSVSRGMIKLVVNIDYYTYSEDIYYEGMFKGQYDLAVGYIPGDEYDPLEMFNTLSSSNKTGLTLNWGEDTTSISETNPIIYNGYTWSLDALVKAAYGEVNVVDGVLA